ncbi:HNH endonuclease signature motif containing protein, partial [Mycolicibacterium canariasense]|uniref:HNH endonuclease signature motif containing protein n=1 Tax=Mycolicibacterium canariasense TaxID=228230 RepID=UPI000A153502
MFDKTRERAAAAVNQMSAAARAENADGARRLAAIGDLYEILAPEDDTEKLCWAIDGHLSLVAEVATALAISRKRAEAQVKLAITLRTRLPNVAAVYATGAIDYRMIATIVARTELITDPTLMARIDTQLAQKAPRWARLSGPKIEQRIDGVIATADPIGVRDPDRPRRDRYVEVTLTQPGMGGVWANVDAVAATAWDRLLNTLAEKTCPADTRTKDQRRADAFAAIATGQHPRCRCEDPDCPARTTPPTPATVGVMIHVIADNATLDGESEGPAYLPGYGALPADMLRKLTDTATTRDLPVPASAAQSGYRPSAALADFIRCRDMTCRFPGCDASAWDCDIDHTVPYPAGPTHPSNLKCLCRFHHLLKTFHTGWNDHQLPDGTVIWTTPTGHTYLTEPEGAHWFPALATPTGKPDL